MTTPDPRTSRSDPIRVHWVPDLPTAGALGLTLAPGKHGTSYYHPADWARDLDTDLDRLRHHHRADVLVSLMEDHEHDLLGISDLRSRARDAGLEVRHFPIPDTSVPPPWRDADSAIARVRKAQPLAVETREQEGYVGRFVNRPG